jgi:hypothetical protein
MDGPNPTIQSWIRDYGSQKEHNYSWGIIIIDDDEKVSIITEGLAIINRPFTRDMLAGIHINYLLIVCNFEKHSKDVQNAILARTTYPGSRVIPFD